MRGPTHSKTIKTTLLDDGVDIGVKLTKEQALWVDAQSGSRASVVRGLIDAEMRREEARKVGLEGVLEEARKVCGA